MSYEDEARTRLEPHENSVVKMAIPFFEQEGAERVYATVCCDRVFVGVEEPTKCGTCDRVPGYVLTCRCGSLSHGETADGEPVCETCISYAD